MAQYIIQDRHTGYVWGDTRDFNDGPQDYDSIVDACRALDESIGVTDRDYVETSAPSGDSCYIVYRVEVGGSEAVAVCHDGQDQEYIEAVERDCELTGFVEWTTTGDTLD